MQYKMDYLINILESLEFMGLNNISYHFDNDRLVLYIATDKDLPKLLTTSLTKSHVLFVSNPYICIKQTNKIIRQTVYMIDNKTHYFPVRLYGITLILTLKLHFKEYFYNILNEMALDGNVCSVSKIREKMKCSKTTITKRKSECKIKKLNDVGKLDPYAIIGQFNKQCIILKCQNAIIVCDQHAVHERIRLEALLKKCKDVEYCKNKACRGAIKFGCILEISRMKILIEDVIKCTMPFICAHGRPSVVIIKID